MLVLRSLLWVIILASTVQAQYEPVQIPIDSKFTSEVFFEESKDREGESTSNGVKNGVRYKLFHHNASGYIQGTKGQVFADGKMELDSNVWHLRCHRYLAADSKTCATLRNGIAFIVNVEKRSGTIPWLTTVSGHMGLSAPSLIEVDGVTVYQENKMATDVMERLSKGKKATVRIAPNVNFPEGRVISFDLHGFNEAIELCNWAVKQIQ